MALRRNPKKEDIEEVKQDYINWANGISKFPDEPTGAGEKYLRGRVEVWLSDFISYAFFCPDKSLEDHINNQIIHSRALEELMEEESFGSKLSEETQETINRFIVIAENRIYHIDFKSLDNTRLIFKEIGLRSLEAPEKLSIKDVSEAFKTSASKERLGGLVKGMQPGKIKKKLDDAITKIYDYSLEGIEDNDRDSKKKLKKKLAEAEELVKVTNGFIKSREDRLFPGIKYSLESRVGVIDLALNSFLEA